MDEWGALQTGGNIEMHYDYLKVPVPKSLENEFSFNWQNIIQIVGG